MAQKNRLKKDNTERIARAQARKARNVAANAARHTLNVDTLKEMSANATGHKNERPSKVVRIINRSLSGKHGAWMEAAAASGATPPDLYSTAEHLHIVAERAKARKVAAAIGAE